MTRGRRLLLPFAVGVAAGVAAAITVPKLAAPLLPAASRGERQLLLGVVRFKQLESERLVLTVPTAEGTVLATFTDGRSNVDRLVQEGDSLTLRVREYEPFVKDPEIARVIAVRHRTEPAGAPIETEGARLGGEVEMPGDRPDSAPPLPYR